MSRRGALVSIYSAGAPTSANIYGITPCTGCEPAVSYVSTLVDFLAVLNSLKMSIDNYFPVSHIVGPMSAPFQSRGTMSLGLYTRVTWVKQHAVTFGKFDVNSLLHVTLLKTIYYNLGYDWHTDPWLEAWPSNVAGPVTG